MRTKFLLALAGLLAVAVPNLAHAQLAEVPLVKRYSVAGYAGFADSSFFATKFAGTTATIDTLFVNPSAGASLADAAFQVPNGQLNADSVFAFRLTLSLYTGSTVAAAVNTYASGGDASLDTVRVATDVSVDGLRWHAVNTQTINLGSSGTGYATFNTLAYPAGGTTVPVGGRLVGVTRVRVRLTHDVSGPAEFSFLRAALQYVRHPLLSRQGL